MSLGDFLAARAKSRANYDGIDVATAYDDPELEWASLDARAALVDTRFRRTIIASGDERRQFLHGQLSQSLVTLKTGDGAPALLLNAQGRVIAILAVYDEGETFEIMVEASHLDVTVERLQQFLVADDVDFQVEEPRDRFAVIGPDACHMLEGMGIPIPSRADASSSGAWFMRSGRLGGVDVLAYGRADLRVPTVEIVAADGAPAWRALEAAGAKPAGSSAYETLRIESGTPRYGVDVDQNRVALEARLEWAIHFRKGCYVGQEIVERAVSRGRVNRVLALLGTDRPARPGERVGHAGEKDIVTSSVVSPRSGPICLAYIPRENAEPGTKLVIERRDRDVVARVLPWPRAEVYPGR